MTSIRGATTVVENTKNAMLEATRELLLEIIDANELDLRDIIDITFSATKDLNAVYPAVAAREIGITKAGLFCVQEMDVVDSLPMCIRVMFHVDFPGKRQWDMSHVYLRDAKILRPDLIHIAVAIDGPSGAGKSTVARKVATKSGSIYVDTGAMYRAVALYNMRKEIDLGDQSAVEKSLSAISIDIRYDSQKSQRLILNGDDVSNALRTQQVAEGSSIVASYPAVRKKLVHLQQSLARKHDIVMDGRDIGTHVLPDAQVKIYLDASIDERIRRRMGELNEKGLPAEYADVKGAIEARDYRDMNRTHAPLTQAKNSIYIKSDGMTVEEISKMILAEMDKVR